MGRTAAQAIAVQAGVVREDAVQDDAAGATVTPRPGDGAGTLGELLDAVPEGWTTAEHAGRRYGLSRTDRVGGRVVTLLAHELGGTDLVSANVYRTSRGDELRACEMPDERVLDFLRGWRRVPDGGDPSTTPPPPTPGAVPHR